MSKRTLACLLLLLLAAIAVYTPVPIEEHIVYGTIINVSREDTQIFDGEFTHTSTDYYADVFINNEPNTVRVSIDSATYNAFMRHPENNNFQAILQTLTTSDTKAYRIIKLNITR